MKSIFETQFKTALNQENIFPLLQPIVHLNTRTVVGYEALARYLDKNQEIVSMGNYIPLLEKNGEVTLLDFSIFGQVCKLIQREEQKAPFDLRIWTNFSRQHFLQKDFSKTFLAIMEHYQIQPYQIGIEVTENISIEKDSNVKQNITKLTSSNIHISIDDFGEGVTSYKDFNFFDANVFKLDKKLLHHKECRQNIIDLIALGKEKGMKVISEGVETREQMEFLKENHCEYVQGFYYYAPLPAKEAFSLLHTSNPTHF